MDGYPRASKRAVAHPGGVDPAALDEVSGDAGSGAGRGDSRTVARRRLLVKMNWYGKTFVNPFDAKPLICRDPERPVLRRQDHERAATMISNAIPVFDQFYHFPLERD